MPYLWPPSLAELNLWEKKLILHLDKCFNVRLLDPTDRRKNCLLSNYSAADHSQGSPLWRAGQSLTKSVINGVFLII